MKLIIAGSRTLTNVDIGAIIRELKLEPTEIVSGGAQGIDSLAFDFAWKDGIPIKRFLPDWDMHGRAAGPIRNAEMVKYADALLAIWDGRSRGTRDVIDKATKRGLLVYQRTFQNG